MKKCSRLRLLIIGGLLFMASCVDTRVSTKTPSPTSITSIEIMPPTASPTFLPNFGDSAFQPLNSNELQAFVMFHLNQRVEISEINTFFGEAESRHAWIDGRQIDFDGDNKEEVFLSIGFYPEGSDSTENTFLIAKQNQDQYEVVYSLSETAYSIPKIEFTDDFNGDHLPELIFTRALAGNGTGADIFVARSQNSTFIVDRVAETDLIIDKIRAGSPDTNGVKGLVVIGFEPGWESSGPGRTIEETYSVVNEKYALLQSRYLPDEYRIHVLQDAQIAYDTGDEELAVELWEQAAYDPSLINFSSLRMENDLPEKYQPAFALYRLYTYFLSKNDTEKAQKYWAELQSKYPEGSPGGEFITLATEAKRLLAVSRDPGVVCDGIYAFLNSTNENASFMMQHWYWGDHNLEIVDFCPLPR